jgi:hypothetical protein
MESNWKAFKSPNIIISLQYFIPGIQRAAGANLSRARIKYRILDTRRMRTDERNRAKPTHAETYIELPGERTFPRRNDERTNIYRLLLYMINLPASSRVLLPFPVVLIFWYQYSNFFSAWVN